MTITKKQLKLITKMVLKEILQKSSTATSFIDRLQKAMGGEAMTNHPIVTKTKDAKQFLDTVTKQLEQNANGILKAVIRGNNDEYKLLSYHLVDNQGSIWEICTKWCKKTVTDFPDDKTSITVEHIIKELRNHLQEYVKQLNVVVESIRTYHNLINAKHQIAEMKNIIVQLRSSIKEIFDLYDNLNANKVSVGGRRG